jgi:hypothetical protein
MYNLTTYQDSPPTTTADAFDLNSLDARQMVQRQLAAMANSLVRSMHTQTTNSPPPQATLQ